MKWLENLEVDFQDFGCWKLMASAAIFSSLRRQRSPSLEAFLAPVDLTDVGLL